MSDKNVDTYGQIIYPELPDPPYDIVLDPVEMNPPFSDREIEILQLMANEHTMYDDIAQQLHISRDTVSNHLKNIKEKFKVLGRGELDATNFVPELLRMRLASARPRNRE